MSAGNKYLLDGSSPLVGGHFCDATSPALVGGQQRNESKVQLQKTENKSRYFFVSFFFTKPQLIKLLWKNIFNR